MILTPGHVLTVDDVLELSRCLEPAWRVRKRRLNARDEALRAAAMTFTATGATALARAVARTLDRHLAGRPIPNAFLFERISLLNGGRPLSHRQVFDILRGERTIVR